MEELIPITMFMCIAAVMILRPITKRLGALLEVMTRERLQQQTPAPAYSDAQLARMTTILERMSTRLENVEDRLDFTERLIGSGRRESSVRPFDDVGLPRETAHSFRG